MANGAMADPSSRPGFELPSTSVDRVGLLGGSFNPAHEGHRYISLEGLKRLGLKEVWWLVSPQNPLKSADDMAPLDVRLQQARHAARSRRIRVTNVEDQIGTRFSVDTISALKRRFSKTNFVWLMGADNLLQMPKWRDWKTIFESVPIAVFTRSSYSRKALTGAAAKHFADCRIRESAGVELVEYSPPAWVFLHTKPHPVSATRIRKSKTLEERYHARSNSDGNDNKLTRGRS
jgi:nicotinate-nucleotide adenylyltransferase